MKRRTEIQLALLAVGLIVWAYGQRSDDTMFQYAGIGCFAVATLLRLFKKRDSEPDDSGASEPPQQ
jgi:hypothetical protein